MQTQQVNTQGIQKVHPKWLFRHKLKPKPVMPSITPFLSASHLCFVLPGHVGPMPSEEQKGEGSWGGRDILLQLYKTFLHSLMGEGR